MLQALFRYFFLVYFCKHCEHLTLYIRVYRGIWGIWGITFSLFPLYFIFKEFNVYNVYVLFKSSIYAVFIVNNRLFTVCLPCLHFQILYVYIFPNVYGFGLIIIFYNAPTGATVCIFLCLPLPRILILTFLNIFPVFPRSSTPHACIVSQNSPACVSCSFIDLAIYYYSFHS